MAVKKKPRLLRVSECEICKIVFPGSPYTVIYTKNRNKAPSTARVCETCWYRQNRSASFVYVNGRRVRIKGDTDPA